MTRRSSIALAAGITTILSITTGTDAWVFDHNHAKVAALHVRQDAAARSAMLPVSYDPTAAGTGGPTGSLGPTIGISSSLYNDSIPLFPSTTIQEPIATVCPGQPADSGIFTILSDPTQTISATAVLADGSNVTFASTSAPSAAAVAPGEARIAVDASGCQTLFAPRVTAICSTVISPVGIPEVTVTDCEQWVTFSSDTKICPTVAPPTQPTILPTLSTSVRNTILEAAPSAQPDSPAQPVQPIQDSEPSQPPATAAQPPLPASEPEQPAASASVEVSAEPAADVPAISTDNLLGSTSLPPNPDANTSDLPTLIVSVIPVPSDSPETPTAPSAAPTDDTTTNANTTAPLDRRQAPASITPAILPIPTPPSADYTAPGTYYAAAWYDVARGGVPARVRAVECDVGTAVNGNAAAPQCSTYQERWTATSFVRTVTETRPVSYSGPVVVTDGTQTYTTTISIATFTTTTRVTYTPTVIKQRLLADNPTPAVATGGAGVFAAKTGGQDGNGEEEGPQSTVTMTGTVTLTNTVYQGVVTSVLGGPLGIGEVGRDGVRTMSLVSKGAA